MDASTGYKPVDREPQRSQRMSHRQREDDSRSRRRPDEDGQASRSGRDHENGRRKPGWLPRK